MAKTVITAPRQPQKAATRPAQPPVTERSTAQEPPPAPEAVLSEAEAIEQRLQDGLAGVEGQQADHRAALEKIAADLAALPGRIEEAERRVSALQQEQAALPRRLNAARAVLVGVMGTQGEGQARAEIDQLQVRQETLPRDLAEAESTLSATRADCEQARASLEHAQSDHHAELDRLREFAQALRDQAAEQRRAIGHAKLAALQTERAAQVAALEQAETQTAEARAALADLDKEAQAALKDWTDLLLQFQQAYIPVDDEKARRLRALLEYRKAFRGWCNSPSWNLDMPVRWFMVAAHELDTRFMDMSITEIEQALEKHIKEAQQRLR
jgi:predicted  nucleic acid-binding Zn-ribbon protein